MVMPRHHVLEITRGHNAEIIGVTTSRSVTGKTPAPKDTNCESSNSGPWCRHIGPVKPSKQKQHIADQVTKLPHTSQLPCTASCVLETAAEPEASRGRLLQVQ